MLENEDIHIQLNASFKKIFFTNNTYIICYGNYSNQKTDHFNTLNNWTQNILIWLGYLINIYSKLFFQIYSWWSELSTCHPEFPTSKQGLKFQSFFPSMILMIVIIQFHQNICLSFPLQNCLLYILWAN